MVILHLLMSMFLFPCFSLFLFVLRVTIAHFPDTARSCHSLTVRLTQTGVSVRLDPYFPVLCVCLLLVCGTARSFALEMDVFLPTRTHTLMGSAHWLLQSGGATTSATPFPTRSDRTVVPCYHYVRIY